MEKERNEEQSMTVQEENYVMMGFEGLGRSTTTKTQVFTNITDEKQIFNLENNVTCLLNDCEGEKIRVKEVLIKRFEKPLETPIINEETGEIEKDREISMSCVIVDTEGKSYATGSKIFTIHLMKFLELQNRKGKTNETFDIKIIRKKVGDRGNKALSFELV